MKYSLHIKDENLFDLNLKGRRIFSIIFYFKISMVKWGKKRKKQKNRKQNSYKIQDLFYSSISSLADPEGVLMCWTSDLMGHTNKNTQIF